MKATHCITSLGEEAAGPSQAVPGLVRALGRLGVETELCSMGELPISGGELPKWAGKLLRVMALRFYLLRVGEPDVYHGHGIWELPVHYMSAVARKRGRPYLIAPHGMLEPWALRFSAWKKRLAGVLFQDRDLQRADCLHAVTQAEVKSFRDYGLENPVAVVPNGVDLEELQPSRERGERFRAKFPRTKDRKIVLFLSRIHPKKGLEMLIEVWGRVRREFAEWALVIAGPDQLGHRAKIEAMVEGLGLADSVVFTGPLYEEDKLAALSAADVFVLPSHSEGFSVAVLEAMSCGLPVLITSGCNFPEAATAGVGVVCESEPADLQRSLCALLGARDAERGEMGMRGKALMEARFTWERLAAQMLEVYEWLLGRRDRPDHVIVD